MASKYYTDAGKEVYNGEVAEDSDLNDINTSVDTGFELVEVDIVTASDSVQYYAARAEEWAESALEIDIGSYSSKYHAEAAEASADAAAASAVLAASYGGIVDSGSDSNGYYIKYSDGTMDQWGSSHDYVTIATTWGDIKKSASEAVTLPEAFASSDYVVSASVEAGGIAPWVGLTGPTNSSSFYIVFYAASSSGSFTDGWSWRAIGKWS